MKHAGTVTLSIEDGRGIVTVPCVLCFVYAPLTFFIAQERSRNPDGGARRRTVLCKSASPLLVARCECNFADVFYLDGRCSLGTFRDDDQEIIPYVLGRAAVFIEYSSQYYVLEVE